MKRLKMYVPAICVFSLALLVRIVYNVTIARNYTPSYDAAIYNNLAEQLLKWHCYCLFNKGHQHLLTTFRAPLWPFIIAGIYAVVGEHNLYPRLLYCVLGAGTCVFAYLLAQDLFGQKIALITGIIAALYPGLFIWDGWLYSESLFTFCVTALIVSFTRLQQSIQWGVKVGKKHQVSWRWMIIGGILLGLTLLTRPTGTIFIGMLVLWAALLVYAKELPAQAVAKILVVVILIAVAINLPWLYRNYTVTHSLSPISTVGTTLNGAYNDNELYAGAGMWGGGPHTAINPDFQPYTVADEKKDTDQALSWMRNHLSAMPTLFGLHLLHFWTPSMKSFGLPFEVTTEMPSASHFVKPAISIMPGVITFATIPIFMLAAFGLIVTWTRKRKQLLMEYLVIVLIVLQSVIFYGSPRFRAPIEPLLLLLAGGALWWLLCDEPGTFRHWRSNKGNVQKAVACSQLASPVN